MFETRKGTLLDQLKFSMRNFSAEFNAVVIGASGGIGRAVFEILSTDAPCRQVIGLSRHSTPSIDLTDEESISRACQFVREVAGEVELIFVATGVLDIGENGPEKTIQALDPAFMAKCFAINAIGPGLLFKHFSDLLPRDKRSVFVTLSARVGSIGDNRIGGWISYRASKAALNQVVRTSAIEIARKRPHAICVALHPGTVATSLSAPYAGSRDVLTPAQSTRYMLDVLDNLNSNASGKFFAWDGTFVEW